MSEQEKLLEISSELKRVEDEIKYHKDEFNDSIRELVEAKKALALENKKLRDFITNMGVKDEGSLIDGISVSYRNDFEVDELMLGSEYWLRVPDTSKIRKELVDSEWTKPIKGVRVIKKPSLRVSSK